MSTLAFGTTAGMLDSFSILERIIAIETKRWVNIQFFAGSLNRKPDMLIKGMKITAVRKLSEALKAI
ncbi:MAG: hypothetical protein U9N60_12310 [Thermodesulfobacteriota bacterium]|nr:hypothetical protein [Thermodesulfobacteriota bacterium]